MIFFSVQKFLKGNLKASFVVKVFLMGITILDRRILFVKFWLWRALKVESRPSDLPPRYVLKSLNPKNSDFLSSMQKTFSLLIFIFITTGQTNNPYEQFHNFTAYDCFQAFQITFNLEKNLCRDY